MTSKIKAHKFVSPAGVSTNSASAVKLVRGATLSFNRMGASVEGIGKILEDINLTTCMNLSLDTEIN